MPLALIGAGAAWLIANRRRGAPRRIGVRGRWDYESRRPGYEDYNQYSRSRFGRSDEYGDYAGYAREYGREEFDQDEYGRAEYGAGYAGAAGYGEPVEEYRGEYQYEGEVEAAERALGKLSFSDVPPRLSALLNLAAADLAMKRVDSAAAEQRLRLAREAAKQARILPLMGEVEKAEKQLQLPVARALERGVEQPLSLREVPPIWASGKLVVDACRREARLGKNVVSLVTRPVLFELLLALGEAAPGDVARDALILRAFGARRVNDSHRVRLRVELGRLRKLLARLSEVRATVAGFELAPRGGTSCTVLLPPADGEASALLALLRGGEAWATSALAAAVGKSQRGVQRALLGLERDGKVRAVGAGRARRWVAAPSAGFTTTLLLVVPGALG